MPFTVGDAFVELRPSLANDFAEASERVVTAALTGITASIGQKVEELGATLTRRLTVPIAIGTAANVTQFGALDAKLRDTITLFGTGGSEVNELFDEFRFGIRDVSDELGVFEQSLSEGLYQAISAGIPRDNVFEFLEVAQKAAIGGSLDATTAVNGLTTAVNTFAASGLTASQAADVLFRGVARGKTTFAELSREMASAAPLAANAGISFEELIATVSTMTLAGTPTAEAFTQVRAAITGLLRPSEEMTAIFREAGFETQAAAVQALGYQGALEVLFEATEGEVGALIKLLGGAEAANAALQVTGDNAARFADIMNDTANATGAADKAFQTMQRGSSRTFGQFFSQIDRFGSNLGELAFEVIAPFVRGLTSLVASLNAAVEWFARLPAPIRIAGSALVIFSAAIGPLLILTGKLLPLIGLLGVRFVSISKILTTLRLGSLIRLVAGSLLHLAAVAIGGIPALSGVADVLTGLRNKALAPLVKSLGGSLAVWGAVGVAIGAVVAAGVLYNNWARKVVAENKVVVDGAKALAESLNLVVEPVETLDQIGDVELSFDFRAENAELINDLRRSRDEGLLEDKLVRISYQLLSLGNTPEDVRVAIEKLAAAANVRIPISFEIPEGPQDVTRTLGGLSTEVQLLVDTFIDEQARLFRAVDFWTAHPFDLFSREAKEIEGTLQGVGEEIAVVFSEGNYAESIAALREIEEILSGVSPEAMDEVTDAFINFINESQGLDISTRGVTSVDDLIVKINESLAIQRGELEISTDAWSRRARAQHSVNRVSEGSESTIEGVTEKLKQQYQSLGIARTELSNFANEIQSNVLRRLQDLRGELESQIPLFGEYEGAAKRTPKEIIDSLNKFSEDLVRWNELYSDLAGEIPDNIRTRLNELPLEQRAALAEMAEKTPSQFQKVLDAYTTAFDTAKSEAEILWKEELPNLIEEGNELLAQKARFLEIEFGIIGASTAESWRNEFARVASTWADTVAFYAGNAAGAFTGFVPTGVIPQQQTSGSTPGVQPPFVAQLSRPPIDLPGASGGAGTVNYNYDIDVQGVRLDDPARAGERILEVVRTTELWERVR